jgi:hypothetical protein
MLRDEPRAGALVSPSLVRLLALLWMFPVYPLAVLIGWVVVPGVALAALFTESATPRAFVAHMVTCSWTDLPRRYASAARELVTGVQL